MVNLLRWMELNNPDGRYNFLIQEMKKNPDYSLLDLMKYLDKNAGEEKFQPLKDKINNNTMVDDLIKYMKKNNQNGAYSNLIENMVHCRNPKVSDILLYCKDKKETEPLVREVTQRH